MTKIIHRREFISICWFVFLLTPKQTYCQDTVLNKYGLWIINSAKLLQKTITENSDKNIVNLKKHIPGIHFDLKYATTNNFTGKRLYPKIKSTYLRRPAADALAIIQQKLELKNLGLKIFDAYRPYSVTEKMWVLVQDDRYAADPKKGSGHNRGIAVDLTIINLVTKEELDMGTNFDNFSDTAHHAFTNLPEVVLQNRLLLKTIMEQHGFKALDTEWWHYYLPNAKEYELLNIPFAKLGKKKRK